MQLHRESLWDELRDIQQDEGAPEGGEFSSRGKRVQVKLGKLKPGNCCSVGAIMGDDGNIVSDPRLIVEELRRYWSGVFTRSSCNEELLKDWAQEDGSLPDWAGFEDDWRPSREEMVRVVANTGKSAPGPDGIPYAVWRRLGDLAIDTLYEAALIFTTGDMDGRLSEADPSRMGIPMVLMLATRSFSLKRLPVLTHCWGTTTRLVMLGP